MRTKLHLLASAPIAIAAMTALSPTAAMAQDAPVVVLDIPETTTVPTAPAPVIVLPDPVEAQPFATTGTPVATTAETATPPRQSQTTATRSSPATTSSRSAAPAVDEPAAPVVVQDSTAPISEGSMATTSASEPVVDARTVLDPVPAPVQDNSTAALLFGLLAAGGIGLSAFLLFRSRRRRRVVEVEPIELPIVRNPEPVTVAPAAASYRAPLDTAPASPANVRPLRFLPNCPPAAPSAAACCSG